MWIVSLYSYLGTVHYIRGTVAWPKVSTSEAGTNAIKTSADEVLVTTFKNHKLSPQARAKPASLRSASRFLAVPGHARRGCRKFKLRQVAVLALLVLYRVRDTSILTYVRMVRKYSVPGYQINYVTYASNHDLGQNGRLP